MEKVNYIVQMNAALDSFNNDWRIKQGHITLYLAFFQKWNREFFKKTITINRELVMERAKIKSKTTYHNILKDLNDWGYLQYYPSYDPRRGSVIRMAIFFAQPGQKLGKYLQEPSQNMVSSYKQKTFKNYNKLAKPFNILEVLLFFKTNNWTADEGKKYYEYYQERDWKLSRGLEIKDWKIAARKFVEKGREMERESTRPFSGQHDYLHSKQEKDYGMPL
ncbi:hypothetical protein OE09_0395 [Flavobacteriaceae bacterium MAR_2010_72]|nr:hypothetical protein OE09_0395 [Flavobacteriaceae bacterium MAR_2010_72]